MACWVRVGGVLYTRQGYCCAVRCARGNDYVMMHSAAELNSYRACKSRARKRGWGSWGQEVHILHVNI